MEIDQDFKEFIKLLNKYKVKYLVVGGYAVAAYGYLRYTGDIDFWIEQESNNAKKIIKAFIEFGFGALDIDQEDFVKPDFVVQLGYPPNRIDILTGVSDLAFEECWNDKKTIYMQDEQINFISLHHLKINKKSSGRDKVLNDLKHLP